ncbi:hypothetical protein R2R35_02920 [Anaerocolumna sp. AGMB13020]|uniref:hypothetical protein n=1 Tax=Anaerocolumna sp. AGMB13020 TaxID=3081750 RepID=UPI002953A0D9|nr:hypothetical protein [Anaerocolumna sp. AGMB13020]WOO37465.1 hypothetical protein R2R35_02920 [Anaerocolumna sp. AGMB13020]
MFEELNSKLEQSRQNIGKYQRLGNKLTDYRKQLNELEDKKSNLLTELKKEERDYDNLLKKSLNNLFLEMLGKMEAREQKEYQDVIAVKLKLEETETQLMNLKTSIHQLEEERASLYSCEREYEELYQLKYRQLSESNAEYAKRLQTFEEQLQSIKCNLAEIREAEAAGRAVLSKIELAEEKLDSAHGWGTWDILGGGLISDVMKHSYLDDAQEAVNSIQTLLHHFHTELADIKLDENLSVQINGFTKFADFFFDGLFSDWAVQSKINSSIEDITRLHSSVDRVMDKLNTLRKTAEGDLTRTEEQRKNFIENS